MTNPAKLLALAERCEREEPSRELDAAIGCALRWAPDDAPWWVKNWGGEFAPMPGGPVGRIAALHSDGTRATNWSAPEFTSPLDAAQTIVPEHHSYELAFSAAGEGATRRCRMWDWRRSPPAFDPGNRWEATARTLPLALVAACLRAIAAQGE